MHPGLSAGESRLPRMHYITKLTKQTLVGFSFSDFCCGTSMATTFLEISVEG
jgi:hypothetical protein